jgi:hypothetical protein
VTSSFSLYRRAEGGERHGDGMAEVEEGREAGELSSTILMDYLGVGIGAGLAGASIALADAGTISIEGGLAGAFAIGIVAAVLLTTVARRLPDARAA